MTTPPNAPEVDVLASLDATARELRYSGEHEDADTIDVIRTAVAAMLTREAALVAERDKDRACLQMIYKELQHIAPWSESNDMETVDEIMCGLGLLAQDRDALAAEVGALRELVEAGRRAIGGHVAPEHCYSTGPLTGNPILDLVECPACAFIATYDARKIAIDAARAEAGHG